MNAFVEAHAALEAETTATEGPSKTVPAHAEIVGGCEYWRNAKGHLVPVETIAVTDQLMDEVVRKIVRYTLALQAQISRYKGHTLDDILGIREVFAQEYNVTLGGPKGNTTFTQFDGLAKVSVKIADVTVWGPELELAKAKVDQCLREWTEGAMPELRAFVEAAFQVDKAGQINRANLLYLLRLKIDNPTWNEGMDLIRTAERPMGSKEYVQVHLRDELGGSWRHVAIDLAAA